ncbi:MAG TPA: alpha/beta fold hydrolase [Patescibacteria group bacterium]
MVKKFLKSVKGILFYDPNLLYKEERHLVNQPFYFKGNNGKAVLLIHGWTSTPYEVRRFGKYLNENGYTVYAPQLKGHGTVPKDLESVRWTDWMEDLEKAYAFLLQEENKIYLAGTSIGANLAVILAARKKNIAGIILMAMPYRIKFEVPALLFAKFLKIFKSYNKKRYPPTFGVSTTITRLISYQTYPIQNALEVHDLIEKSREALPKINQPCFVIQSASDHIIQKNSLEIIYSKINSSIKKKQYISRAYHTFISDIKNDRIFQDILNFLEEN